MVIGFLEHIGFVTLLIIVFFFLLNFKKLKIGKIKRSKIKKDFGIFGK